ncbi:MAG TPA: hypothetical protein VMF89_12880, partial [Polyangiales bacterium]|nr:hypothetical protein [Polyangiales bacterium]
GGQHGRLPAVLAISRKRMQISKPWRLHPAAPAEGCRAWNTGCSASSNNRQAEVDCQSAV